MSERTLFVFPGSEDVPSLHLDCLKTILYSEFAQLQGIKLQYSLRADCPILKDGEAHIVGSRNIIAHLNKTQTNSNLDAPYQINLRTKSCLVAFQSLADSSLADVVDQSLWNVPENFNNYTLPQLKKQIGFIGSPWIQLTKQSTCNVLATKYKSSWVSPTSGEVYSQVYELASKALRAFESRSMNAQSGFLFGDSPSSVDVALLATLSLLLLPLPTTRSVQLVPDSLRKYFSSSLSSKFSFVHTRFTSILPVSSDSWVSPFTSHFYKYLPDFSYGSDPISNTSSQGLSFSQRFGIDFGNVVAFVGAGILAVAYASNAGIIDVRLPSLTVNDDEEDEDEELADDGREEDDDDEEIYEDDENDDLDEEETRDVEDDTDAGER